MIINDIQLMRVCIGGTFNILHKGHKTLINKAFQIAGKQGSVFIGITKGEISNQKKNVKTLIERKKAIKQYVLEKGYINRAIIKPINNKYGPSTNGVFDAIVVSAETARTAEEINKILRQNGKKPLRIIQIPFVLADDNLPISSSRIKKGEIDTDGRLLRGD